MANFLAEYNCLTPELIVKIFNNKFIDKMTEYTKIPKFKYPSHSTLRIKQSKNSDPAPHYEERYLATLNQLVCATYPHYNIPWFNENYKRKEFAGMRM